MSSLKEKVVQFDMERTRLRPALSSGGPGDTYDPMEARVKALENAFEKIDGKLDRVIDGLADVRVDLAAIKAALPTKADQADLTAVRGSITHLPTIWQIITAIGVIMGGAFAVARWGVGPH